MSQATQEKKGGGAAPILFCHPAQEAGGREKEGIFSVSRRPIPKKKKMYKNKKMGKKTNPGPRRGSARPCLVSRIMVTSCLGGSGPVSLSRVTIAGHKLLLRQLRGKLPPLILRTPGLLLSGQGETIICPSSPFRACHVSLGGPIKNAQTPFLSWSGTAAETRSVWQECPRCVRQLYSGSCESFLEIHP